MTVRRYADPTIADVMDPDASISNRRHGACDVTMNTPAREDRGHTFKQKVLAVGKSPLVRHWQPEAWIRQRGS